jgi:ribosome-associated protein
MKLHLKNIRSMMTCLNLAELIKSVNVVQKKRIATKPTKGSVNRQLQSKKKHAGKKRLRGKVDEE